MLPFYAEELFSIKETICAFLNTKGGRIYIGIDKKDSRVKGIKISQ